MLMGCYSFVYMVIPSALFLCVAGTPAEILPLVEAVPKNRKNEHNVKAKGAVWAIFCQDNVFCQHKHGGIFSLNSEIMCEVFSTVLAFILLFIDQICWCCVKILSSGKQMAQSRMRTSRVRPLICTWTMIWICWGQSRSRWADWHGEFTRPTGWLWAECWPTPSYSLCSSCKVWAHSASLNDLCTVMTSTNTSVILCNSASKNVSDWWLSHWISELKNNGSTWTNGSSSAAVSSPHLLLFSPGGLMWVIEPEKLRLAHHIFTV